MEGSLASKFAAVASPPSLAYFCRPSRTDGLLRGVGFCLSRQASPRRQGGPSTLQLGQGMIRLPEAGAGGGGGALQHGLRRCGLRLGMAGGHESLVVHHRQSPRSSCSAQPSTCVKMGQDTSQPALGADWSQPTSRPLL